jgi:transposase
MGVAGAARTFGVHRDTATAWANAYHRDGAALAARRRGLESQPLLSAAQEARLLGVLRDRTPDQLGLADTIWTRDAVADWVALELGGRRSRWVWGRWLGAKGFAPQRPARRAYERDPAAAERWLSEGRPKVEAKAEGAEVHRLDEAGVRSDCNFGRGYAPARADRRFRRCRAGAGASSTSPL